MSINILPIYNCPITPRSSLRSSSRRSRPDHPDLCVKTRVITELRVLRTMPVLAADGLMEIVEMQILVVKQITETWVTASKPGFKNFWWINRQCD